MDKANPLMDLQDKIKHYVTGTETPVHLTEREKVMLINFEDFHRQECRSIAIAFAKHRSRVIAYNSENNVLPSDEELFDKFLKEYYK